MDVIKDILATTGTTPTTVQAGYGASLSSDVALFESSMQKAERSNASQSTSEIAKAIVEPLDRLNLEAAELLDFSKKAIASDNDLSPSEIISLTVKSQEFMFHSQLTANVANRTADGIQQLFRQQG